VLLALEILRIYAPKPPKLLDMKENENRQKTYNVLKKKACEDEY